MFFLKWDNSCFLIIAYPVFPVSNTTIQTYYTDFWIQNAIMQQIEEMRFSVKKQNATCSDRHKVHMQIRPQVLESCLPVLHRERLGFLRSVYIFAAALCLRVQKNLFQCLKVYEYRHVLGYLDLKYDMITGVFITCTGFIKWNASYIILIIKCAKTRTCSKCTLKKQSYHF